MEAAKATTGRNMEKANCRAASGLSQAENCWRSISVALVRCCGHIAEGKELYDSVQNATPGKKMLF